MEFDTIISAIKGNFYIKIGGMWTWNLGGACSLVQGVLGIPPKIAAIAGGKLICFKICLFVYA